jgi:uncharacterized repeat protein (TIGR01451 family)
MIAHAKRITLKTFPQGRRKGIDYQTKIAIRRWKGSLLYFLPFYFCFSTLPARGEGSRTLYPSTAPTTSRRANIEWAKDQYAGLFTRRTLLRVFANRDEYILLGSSAVDVNNGNILVYNPGKVTGSIGSETFPTADFNCKTSQPVRGKISNRTQELSGPQSIDGTGNTSGYIPCYYKAPSTGVYTIAMYGPNGSDSTQTGNAPTGELNLNDAKNFDSNQGATVAAWDVTVRNSENSTMDINGRLFSYYYSLLTGANGRPLNFNIYPVTTDGYRYELKLRGLDPFGFILYGSQVGFFDSDGKTPLYHDIIGDNGQVANPQGNTKVASPQYATFVNPIDPTVLPYIDRYRPDGSLAGIGIDINPITPSITNVQFTGNAGGNNSYLGSGGTITFNSNIPGNYQIIISRDGVNFDPTNPQNRVLRGVMATSGLQTVVWDGTDNKFKDASNNPSVFPVGNNYRIRAQIHGGEYHFPLLDAENNVEGGPTITMLNATNPLGNFTAFYDDRGYKTINGTEVGTVGSPLCGINPPNPAFSNPITGFDTRSNDRKFGQSGDNGNRNIKCDPSGSFGDTKGLDLWTYFPAVANNVPFNIIPKSKLLLVKRITRINTTDITSVVDDPNTTDDNNSKWPAGYLKGQTDGGIVKPGDELEYTIYFLSSGIDSVRNARICDLVPVNSEFLENTFAVGSGIALELNGSQSPRTNANDGDRARFIPGSDTNPRPGACNKVDIANGVTPPSPLPATQNPTGAVVLDLVTGTEKFPDTGNAYGWFRFRVKVK